MPLMSGLITTVDYRTGPTFCHEGIELWLRCASRETDFDTVSLERLRRTRLLLPGKAKLRALELTNRVADQFVLQRRIGDPVDQRDDGTGG
jgi:hypothetical protein